MTECIARIDPVTGLVLGWALMHGLRDGRAPTEQRTHSAHVAAAREAERERAGCWRSGGRGGRTC